MDTILITGSNGFIGSGLINKLIKEYRNNKKIHIRAVCRQFLPEWPDFIERFRISELEVDTDWTEALVGCSVIVHLAARVHYLSEKVINPLVDYDKINVRSTLNLARQSADSGVKRFIFISSIKVNGEFTENGHYFNSNDCPAPRDDYALSKFKAEEELREIAKNTGMEVVIIRPPLVYGPGVKANFASMMKWLSLSIPLPLGAITNKRSLIGIENLVDFILVCIRHPKAANQIFLVSDGEDLSTTELLIQTGKALNVPVRLIPFPVWTLEFGFRMLNKQRTVQRLLRSMQVDICKTKEVLGWSPPFTFKDEIHKTAKHFIESIS